MSICLSIFHTQAAQTTYTEKAREREAHTHLLLHKLHLTTHSHTSLPTKLILNADTYLQIYRSQPATTRAPTAAAAAAGAATHNGSAAMLTE